MNKKVVLGLSGGVDSAVAAHVLKESGYEVFGLYLDIAGESAKQDAESVAEALGITLKIADISAELEDKVCRPFVEAYLKGQTPNPCILCNPNVKFKTLLAYADSVDAHYVSTGHFARIIDGNLCKGRAENDQSYMLSRLKKEQVERMILPLGEYSKAEVRQLAERFGLFVAHKPASMEICFIPDKDYGAYIEKRGIAPPEGNFVDENGKVLGKHKGIHRYTIGQRRGLNIAAGKRIFVSEIRPETNEVVLSDGEELFTEDIDVQDVNWLIPKNQSFAADVRVRHSRVSTPAELTPTESGVKVHFLEPVRAPTKGQTAVFYSGDIVVGGGFIV